MKLHTLRNSNPLSAILEDFLSIRFKPHQVYSVDIKILNSEKNVELMEKRLLKNMFKRRIF